jgi:DNA-binding XRE family transcriptional regulator
MQRFPTYVRFARSIGVSRSTLFEWAEHHKEFSDSMKTCNEISEAILLENGLQGTYNSTFAMFLLKNNHGYKDKTEQEHT